MDAFLGEIRLLPYSYAPNYWAACDGSLLQISANVGLYSLLGNAFGGDGQTTFAVPDLREHALSGLTQGGYFIATQGAYPTHS